MTGQAREHRSADDAPATQQCGTDEHQGFSQRSDRAYSFFALASAGALLYFALSRAPLVHALGPPLTSFDLWALRCTFSTMLVWTIVSLAAARTPTKRLVHYQRLTRRALNFFGILTFMVVFT